MACIEDAVTIKMEAGSQGQGGAWLYLRGSAYAHQHCLCRRWKTRYVLGWHGVLVFWRSDGYHRNT